jgi:hypothetical protein
MTADGRDPSGYVTNPPSVVVKVTETTRDDINGLLGIAISYNVERERYLVHMTLTQSTMALKKENMVKANMMESYRAREYPADRSTACAKRKSNHHTVDRWH